MPVGTPWTKEDDAILAELWCSGVPARIIVDKFPERTRNAIIGRVHRLKLVRNLPDTSSKPRYAEWKNRPRRVRSHPFKSRAPIIVQPKATIMREAQSDLFPEAPVDGVSIMELKWYHCRSVADSQSSDGLAMYCGRRTIEGKSFCSYHAAIYYVPYQQRLRRRA